MEISLLTPSLIALLVLAAFVAGFVDAIAGGGGLITIPAFLLAGLNPAQALATNKLQAVFGSGSATLQFARVKMINWREAWPGFCCAFGAAACGALLVTHISAEFLRHVIPYVLVALALYFALAPKMSDETRHHIITPHQHGVGAGTVIGFYDGLFGPGTGSFFVVSLITLVGYGVRKATAHTKLFNFGSNLGSLVVFLFAGKTLIALGLMMVAGQVCGATLGSRSAIKHGAKIIRPLLVVVCAALALRLILS